MNPPRSRGATLPAQPKSAPEKPPVVIGASATAPAPDASDGSDYSPLTWLRGIYARNARGWFDAVGQERIVDVLTSATGKAASGRRPRRIVVQPFDDAASKGLCLGLRTQLSTIELDDAGPLELGGGDHNSR